MFKVILMICLIHNGSPPECETFGSINPIQGIEACEAEIVRATDEVNTNAAKLNLQVVVKAKCESIGAQSEASL